MISVSEAFAFLGPAPKEETPAAVLSAVDLRNAQCMEAAIDAAVHEKFNGAPLRLVFEQTVEPQVAESLKRRYEEYGGWRVFVTPQEKSCTLVLLPMSTQSAGQKTVLPPVALPVHPLSGDGGLRPSILIRMPTRGRPAQALSVLEAYRNLAGMPILLEVVIDEDDESMMHAGVLQRLSALGCTITVGAHKSKIEACNGGRLTDWDILVLASDDMVPVKAGYAVRIQEAMAEHFPYLDGALHFDDGYQHDNCCTLPIFGKRLYKQFGYVYHPDYKSLFCDQEQTEVLRARGQLRYLPETIIEHRHHVVGAPKDALYQRNDALWDADQATYERRRAAGFDEPPLVLSLLIATLPARRARLERLLAELDRQAPESCYGIQPYNGLPKGIIRLRRSIEILVDNREGVTIGAKRQTLLERARGEYVAFIDDDDWIAPDYCSRLFMALHTHLPDCASLSGLMTTAGEVPEHFSCSLKWNGWYTENGLHYRTPNHLNAVRRTLALKAGFLDRSHAEDFDYSKALYPLLKTEADTGERPLYYYWFWPTKKEGT